MAGQRTCRERPQIVVAQGSLACEEAVLDSVGRCLDELGALVLQYPIYVVVPSHSLRSHLLERLVRRRAEGIAGLGCWTLHGFALEVVERLGGAPAPGSDLLPVLIRRRARRERPLRDCLEHLHDGYTAVVGAVRDLLEAGLEVAHADALEEVLLADGPQVASPAEVERARSLLSVAAAVQEEMERLGIGHVSSLLRQATDLLLSSPEPALQPGALHIHGFADATGTATDFIEVLLQRFRGTIYLVRPPDPADPRREDPGIEFSRRFSERLLALVPADPPCPQARPAPPRVTLVRALGMQAEVREVAATIRDLLDGGARPEGIAIVARQLEPFRSALRTHLWRLGIPFSAVGAVGPPLPAGRKIRALLDLVANNLQARVERWLDARDEASDQTPVFDLRLALFGLGAARLEEVAALRLERILRGDDYSLPVRRGYGSEEVDDSPTVLRRRKVAADALRKARREARALSKLFAAWKSCRQLHEHLRCLGELMEALGWSAEGDLTREVQRSMARLAAGLPAELELDFDEMVPLCSDRLGSIGCDRFGGQGGGVQVLDVIEARGRTFEHLFLLGLNKGVFPRTVREDPVLPDSLRQVLGREGHGVLPDLARKLSGFAEERFLFAQLLSASPDITLSWQVADDENRELTPSPLVERLLWAGTIEEGTRPPAIRLARSILASERSGTENMAFRTPHEEALHAALRGSRQQLATALEIALPWADSHAASWLTTTPDCPPISPDSAARLAISRLQILDELDRGPGSGNRLGPYLGFLGAAIDAADPRMGQKLYVTTLERFAECPWQTFLERVLRLETLPDPVEVLPGLDPLLLGQLVHRVLEGLVDEHLQRRPRSLDEARRLRPAKVPWPTAGKLFRHVRREANAVSLEQGIGWDGFADVLARVVLPYLELARELVWDDGTDCRPVGVELDGSLELDSTSECRNLHFKVDRVDVTTSGLLLSDYKTGRKGVSEAKNQKTRQRHLLAEIRGGRLLQAVAYAQASGQNQDRGRYVYLSPDFRGPDDTRLLTIEAQDPETRMAFQSAVGTLLRAWEQGTFFPRLVETEADREPRSCDYCAVSQACLRGDSGARGRLRDWTIASSGSDPTNRAFLDAWWLASNKGTRGARP